MEKPNSASPVSTWLEAPPQAVFAGLYLLLYVVGSVIALFIIFPEVDLDTRVGKKRTLVVPFAHDTILHVEMDPDLAPALTDTLTVKFKFLDSLGHPVAGIREQIATIPAEIVPNGLLVLMILLTGGLGASLYGLTSLVEYVGNDSYVNRWTMWYLMRPFAGAVLALIFYLAGRAGLFEVVDTKDEFYGVLALSTLIGLFSKQALFKLSDIFDVLFRSAREDKLKDKISSGTLPIITAVQPAALTVNAQDRNITVTGTNFSADALLYVNGRELSTSHVGEGLGAELDKADVATAGTLRITVRNSGSLGMVSKPYELKVEPAPQEDVPPQPEEGEGEEEEEG